MDLHLLKSFVAVADELNFRRAAARLHIAQPALSRRITTLESQLGGRLFDRTSRRVALTPAGERVLEEARVVLAQVDRVEAVGRNAMLGQVGLIRVAITNTAVFNPLTADLLHAHRTRWSGVEIELHEMLAAEQYSAVEEGRIELGFVHVDVDLVQAGRRIWPRLNFDLLSREGMVAVVATNHALVARRAVSLAELVDESFIRGPRRSPEYGGPFHRLERLRGKPVLISQHVSNVAAMIHLVGAGMGVAILPDCMSSIHASRVRYIPVSDERDSRLLALVYGQNAKRPDLNNFLTLAPSRRIKQTATS
jgi:DNA-binding transcriptional LysR family regulator